MEKLTLQDLPIADLENRRVLVRVDFNVPLDNGRVTDDTRIRATIPTLSYLLDNKARVILVSHLGRPKGEPSPELTLRPAADRLAELIDQPVHFVPETIGADARAAVEESRPGEVVILENIRFLPGEEANDPKLADNLASLADIYVNDAFGTAHRAHASTAGVAEAMRRGGKPAVAGLLLERELHFLGNALEDPERPFVAIIGGAKISGKIDVIENLLPRVDHLLIGGAMANTFFRALGLETGGSLVEEDRIELAGELLQRAGAKIVLPVDSVVAGQIEPGARTWLLNRDAVPPEGKILDIGPKSVATFRDFIDRARTILWNGPMGIFEIPEFSHGTDDLARAIAEASDRGATSIIGGGDSVAAIEGAGLAERMTHISTGGGASLEFLEGRVLPGVDALNDREIE